MIFHGCIVTACSAVSTGILIHLSLVLNTPGMFVRSVEKVLSHIYFNVVLIRHPMFHFLVFSSSLTLALDMVYRTLVYFSVLLISLKVFRIGLIAQTRGILLMEFVPAVLVREVSRHKLMCSLFFRLLLELIIMIIVVER